MKLKFLIAEINAILNKWNYKSPEQFLDDAKTGVIEEAEDDAITLKQLLKQREELFDLRKKWENS